PRGERIGERDREPREGEGEENAREHSVPSGPRPLRRRFGPETDRGRDEEEGESRQGDDVVSSDESEGDSEGEAREGLRTRHRASDDVGVEDEQGADDRERERRGRANRERDENQVQEGRDRRCPGPPGAVQPTPKGAMEAPEDDADENGRVGPKILSHRFPQGEEEQRDRGDQEDEG